MRFFNLLRRPPHNSGSRARAPKKKDYHSSQYENPHPSREGNGRVWRKLFIFILSIGTLLALLYWTFFSGAFAVTSVEVAGAIRADEYDIRAYTESLLNRRRMLLLTQYSSLFLVDTARIRSRLVERFALKSAQVSPRLPHTVSVHVTERQPAFIVQSASEGIFVIDEDGVLIGPATEEERATELLLTLTLPHLITTTTGEHLFDQSAMRFLNDAEHAFTGTTQGFRVVSLDLARVLVHDLTAHTNEQWVIYMTDTIDPKAQISNVERVLQDIKDARNKIQYIDVRLPTKIFYK